jgi:hypothetical protein
VSWEEFVTREQSLGMSLQNGGDEHVANDCMPLEYFEDAVIL